MGDTQRRQREGWIRARVTNIRQKQGLGSGQGGNVGNFSKHFHCAEYDQAVSCILESNSQEEKVEMLKLMIDSRKNEDICNILQMTKEREETPSLFGFHTSEMYQRSVLMATLNDDPATLAAILHWGKLNENERNLCHDVEASPITLSSLEGYNKCTELLYAAGYRIHLLAEDEYRINSILQSAKPLTNKIQFSVSFSDDKQHIGLFSKEVVDCSGDPVERYLRFKAYCSPHHLAVAFLQSGSDVDSLRHLDPFRKSFVLSQYCNFLSFYFPQHASDYKKIREACQTFAKQILEHCSSGLEVGTLLEHNSREKNIEEDWKNSNWEVALWEGHKSFVSHPYYQYFAWQKICGHKFDPHRHFMVWRILMVPFAGVLFLIYPIIVLVDSICREGDILFVAPEKIKRNAMADSDLEKGIFEGRNEEYENGDDVKQDQEHGFWSFFRERLHRPIYRMYVDILLEMIFLILLYLSLSKPNDGIANFDILDFIVAGFICHYLLEDIVDVFRRGWSFLSSFWNLYSLITNTILVSGGIIALGGLQQAGDDQRAEHSGNHPINVGFTFVSYGATLSCFKIVRWFLIQRQIGPVVICIIRIFKDVLYVFAVFLVIYLSFAIGIWFMFKPFTSRGGGVDHDVCVSLYCLGEETLTQNPGMRGVLSLMFWRVINGDSSSAKVQKLAEYNNNTEVFSLEFSHVMGLSLWAMYQGITVILLINILIALMNSTYLKVWENVDVEWKFSKVFYEVQYLAPRAGFPPPFRWIYYLAKIIWICKIKFGTAKVTQEQKIKTNTNKEKYLSLLQRLVRTKMQSQKETAINDDFDDLRIDITNVLEDNMKKEIVRLHQIIAEKETKIEKLESLTSIRNLK